MGDPTGVADDSYPRPYDLNNADERARLLREVGSYLKTSAFYHEGTDQAGRQFAGTALLRALKLNYHLSPPAEEA